MEDKKEQLIKLLFESDDYLSGQVISDRLGVSRTAVWKYIKKLTAEGYEIDAVKNRGYRLQSSSDVLSETMLLCHMDSVWLGQHVDYKDVTDSTNLEIKRLAEKGAVSGTLSVCDRQESGRGRLGRSWSSPAGSGLWMSVLLRPDISPMKASMVTLVAAMAVSDAVKEISGVDAKIKWPNDLVAEGKKICGILTEMSLEENRISYIVVGIGINVNTDGFPEELLDKAVSLKMLTGKTIKRAALCGLICKKLETYFEAFVSCGNLSFMKDAYNERLVNIGKEVVISDREGSKNCISLGIDESGALLVRNMDGRPEAITSGEVSVRGVYGYV